MQRSHLLLTIVGPDRIGFVDEVTSLIVARGANVEESRMARLAGEFAALVLISIPEDRFDDLTLDLNALRSRGMQVAFRLVSQERATAFGDCRVFDLTVTGADHEGIIRSVAHELTLLGVNIADLKSEVVNAPETGGPLFNMTARIQVPSTLPTDRLEQRLTMRGRQWQWTITAMWS